MFHTINQEKKICADCPFARTASIIGDSVILIIVRELITGTKRFGDLETSLGGVSTKTLSDKLKLLEDKKIIKRKQYVSKPPRVEYFLTKKGEGLHNIYEEMYSYGKKYL